MFPTLSEGTLIDVMQCRRTTPRSFASLSEHCLMTIKRYGNLTASFAYIYVLCTKDCLSGFVNFKVRVFFGFSKINVLRTIILGGSFATCVPSCLYF